MSTRFVICVICVTVILYSMLCENLSLSKVGSSTPLIRPGIEPRQTQGPAGRPGVNEEVSAESPLHRDGPCTLNPPPVVSLSLGEPAPSW